MHIFSKLKAKWENRSQISVSRRWNLCHLLFTHYFDSPVRKLLVGINTAKHVVTYLELQHPPVGHSYKKCSVNVFPHIKASICFIPIYFLWITIYKPWKETEEKEKKGGGGAVGVQGKILFSCVFLNNKEEQRFCFCFLINFHF